MAKNMMVISMAVLLILLIYNLKENFNEGAYGEDGDYSDEYGNPNSNFIPKADFSGKNNPDTSAEKANFGSQLNSQNLLHYLLYDK